MEKKSQITLYIIIGLVLLGLVSIFVYISSKESVPNEKNLVLMEFSLDYIEKSVDDCIYSIVLNTISEEGLCDAKPFKENLEDEISSCLDLSMFEKEGYIVTAKEKPQEVEVEIREDEIYVYVYYPIILKKDSRIEFFERTFKLPRTKSLTLDLKGSVMQRDQVIVSPDLNLELKIPKGTIVEGGEKIELYMKEMCPYDSGLIGSVRYVFSPDLSFSPSAILTARYERKDISPLAEEQAFKIAYLENNEWIPISSSADVEKTMIFGTTNHLSLWTPSCHGTNKYGIQVLWDDVVEKSMIRAVDESLNCANNFSGPCGYAKVVIPMEAFTGTEIDFYKELVNKIYENRLIPIITLKEVIPPKEGRLTSFWTHPGTCNGAESFCKHPEYEGNDASCASYSLDCFYGEDRTGENFPVYDYGSKNIEKSSVWHVLKLLDTIHKATPEWPLYIQIGDEPNLAVEWHNISLTDYEISEYARYYVELASAVKEELNTFSGVEHSNSIKVMPAGLAPTTGMKECRLSPEYSKQYHDEADSYRIEEWGNSYFMKNSCDYLLEMPNYLTEGNNYCVGEPLEEYTAANCPTCKTPGNVAGSCNEYHDDTEMAYCVCPPKNTYVENIRTWYEGYIDKGFQYVFQDLIPDYNNIKDYSCNAGNYNDNAAVESSNKIKQRILDSFHTYCFEKITEVHPDKFIDKIYSYNNNEMCNYLDIYADHTYPDPNNMAYPGGSNPFGATAYEQRFERVASYCNGLIETEPVPPDYTDTDEDGILDYLDNCPYTYNPDQENWNSWRGSNTGDACTDTDNDGIMDSEDLCPTNSDISTLEDIRLLTGNPDLTLEEADIDGDGWANICDNCPYIYNPDQKDLNNNGIGDVCEDIDGDGFPNVILQYNGNYNENEERIICKKEDIGKGECILDNCPYDYNSGQKDEDGDGIGDKCDNCVNIPNPSQKDSNNNGIGDACDNYYDVCPNLEGIQTDPEECPPLDLFDAKIMITEMAWAPHPYQIYKGLPSFNLNDYISDVKRAYERWIDDDNVLAVIPFLIGDSRIVPDDFMDYSWTEEMCRDNCIGKDIFNEISKNKDPIDICKEDEEKTFTGKCKDGKILLQNLGRVVGPNKNVYTYISCDEKQVLGSTVNTYKGADGFSYIYNGLNEAFDIKDIIVEKECIEGDGTVREGNPCIELDIDGTYYYGILRCDPTSLTSAEAWFKTCGTVEECGNDISNCCSKGGSNGHWWSACLSMCEKEEDCPDQSICVENRCINEASCVDEGETKFFNNIPQNDPVNNRDCCDGLVEINPIHAYDEECNQIDIGVGTICSNCGNNVCEKWENICNCPNDCSVICDPDCGDSLICFNGNCVECVVDKDCFYSEKPKICSKENICIDFIECNDLWWYDNDSEECLLDEFCGNYMYEGLNVFDTEDECINELNN